MKSSNLPAKTILWLSVNTNNYFNEADIMAHSFALPLFSLPAPLYILAFSSFPRTVSSQPSASLFTFPQLSSQRDSADRFSACPVLKVSYRSEDL